MKMLVIFLCVSLCLVVQYNAHADCGGMTEQSCLTALKSSDLEVRSKTLNVLQDCPSEFAKPVIQEAIISIVERERKMNAQWDTDSKAGKNPAALGEGYGEYLINLQKMLFKIKGNPQARDALLTSTDISGWNIGKRLVDAYGEKLIPGLIRQFNDKAMWGSNNLEILRLVEQVGETVTLSTDSQKQVREIVVGGLSFSDSYTQQRAIEISASLGLSDDDIIAKIETLSLVEALKGTAVDALAVLRAKRLNSVSTTTVPSSPLLKASTTQLSE